MFSIHVTKDYTVFCAGHFITYEGGQCERLHGHNYRAAVTLEGALDENAYVFDFTTLKKILRGVCDRLDHRMLLPRHNPRLAVMEDASSVTVRYREKTYVFPREDAVLLPIPNTTAEMLAQWIAGEIETELRGRGAQNLAALEVEVEESFGQSAFCRRDLSS
jgi:6-pyruvoyltetrahydropterin/6-carboxytetrahydropterin synthase